VGETCIVENTAYVAYGPDGEFVDIVSRSALLASSTRTMYLKRRHSGNCKVGLYCDAQQLKCVQTKKIGETCDADKECESFNCNSSSKCAKAADAANDVAVWVYVIVAICIIGGAFSTVHASWITF
jgi:hypothetical protein